MGPDREPSAAIPWQRRWLRATGCLFILHASIVGAILSEYSEVALLHEDARVVLQRLQSTLDLDKPCGSGPQHCARQAEDGPSLAALLSEISEEWDQAERATAKAVVLAAISWLLMSTALYATGGSLRVFSAE